MTWSLNAQFHQFYGVSFCTELRAEFTNKDTKLHMMLWK